MKQKRNIVILMVSLGMLGCAEDDNPGQSPQDQDGDTSSADNQPFCEVGDLSGVCANGGLASINLIDDYNYYFSSALDISSVVVRGGSPIVDLTFNWSGVTQDIMGHPVNPLTDIDLVVATVWQLSQADITDMLNRDDLNLTKLWGAVMTYPNDAYTENNLLSFTLYHNPITAPADVALRDSYFNALDPSYDPAKHTHMLIAQTGDQEPGKNVRMLQFFTLDPNSTVTRIDMTSNSASLAYTADLRSLKRIPTSQGNPLIHLNWDNVTLNAGDYEFIPTLITRVVVAHYDMTVCQIEEQFLDLETIHDQWYFADLVEVGTDIDLSTLSTSDGIPFPGISAGGTWIVGLFCTIECSNPAPLFMGVLEPC